MIGLGVGLGRGVLRVDAAAGEHIGARQKTRLGRATGHEDFEHGVAVVCRRIPHQQHRGCGTRFDGLAVGMELLI
ncbi:hypothetical protein SDC9_114307 [bioreactor metagenome]|uniref:Uncharacterized protein n=1 Tax=bioreactor metagenome TaxID=1076179 RepID=A0A645BQ24_9ZZZZ